MSPFAHSTSIALVLLANGLSSVLADGPGSGLSKTTYSANTPLVGLEFNLKYFPVTDAADSCSGDVCTCSIDGVDYEVDQGRVQLETDESSASSDHRLGEPVAGEGFGMHLVNCSTNTYEGGVSTATIEAYFETKLGNMTAYDSFMDYNVALLTTDLDHYSSTFDKDGVNYLPMHWTDQDTNYYGIMVHVPTTQMVVEIMAKNSSATARVAAHPNLLRMGASEQRASRSTLAAGEKRLQSSSSSSSGIFTVISVGRAASDLAALDEFYGNGMRCSTTLSVDDEGNGYSKRCYLWDAAGATADVCFTKRPDSATAGSFKVSDFEDMLNSVHATVTSDSETCNNKWVDNHYAIDGRFAADYIQTYVKNHDLYYYCDSDYMHYAIDPTGWGIQLDAEFTDTSLCLSKEESASSSRRSLLQGPPPPPQNDDHGGGPPADMCPCTGMKYCGGPVST